MDMTKLAACSAAPRPEATPGRGSLRDKTDQELREEIEFWDNEIKTATGWGAALAFADSCRRAAVQEMKIRKHVVMYDSSPGPRTASGSGFDKRGRPL